MNFVTKEHCGALVYIELLIFDVSSDNELRKGRLMQNRPRKIEKRSVGKLVETC